MAKVKLDYMSLSMRAEGSDDMVRELSGRFLDMADKYAAPGFCFPALPPSVFEDGCRDPEELNTGDMKPLTTPKEVAPGADWDVVAIYDDAGIPSIMHRFRRMSNKELFGGSDKPHPAFIIGGEVFGNGEKIINNVVRAIIGGFHDRPVGGRPCYGVFAGFNRGDLFRKFHAA